MFEQDKLAHFAVGFAIAFIFGLFDDPWVKAAGLALGITVGAAKEWVYDKRHPTTHTVDVKDFYATSVGSVVGFTITWKW